MASSPLRRWPIRALLRLALALRINKRLDPVAATLEARTAQLQESERRHRTMLDTVSLIAVMLDRDGRVTYCNDFLANLMGWKREEILGRDWFAECLPPGQAQVKAGFLRLLEGRHLAGHYENEILCRSGERRLVRWSNTLVRSASGAVLGTASLGEDITVERAARTFAEVHHRALEMITRAEPLGTTLEFLARATETQSPRLLASILTLDTDGLHLRHAAAPGLAPDYAAAIDGVRIGARAGSCGTAAFLGQEILVEDIATSPLWEEYRTLAGAHGLRACWSVPIFDASRRVLGTLALYSLVPGLPDELQLRVMRAVAETAGIAIASSRAAEALRENEAKLRSLIDGLGPEMLVGLLTPEGVLLEANQAALTAAGITLGDVLGKPAHETPWFGSEKARRAIRKVIAEAAAGNSRRLEMQIQAGDRLLWLDVSINPVRDADGRIVYLVPSALVIEERKRVEREVLESEERFRQLTDNIRDVFWMTDVAKRVVIYASPAYETIWGRSREALYAAPRDWLEAVHPEDRERVSNAAFACGPERPYDEEYRIRRPDGTTRWIHDRGFAVRDATGTFFRVAGIAEDITERRLAQDLLGENGARLEALTRRLLQIQEAERRAMARELHDEVGSALTAVRLNLQALRARQVGAGRNAAIADSLAVVDSAIHSVRSLSLDLRPTVLDDLGLVPAIRWYCKRQQERSGIAIDMNLDAVDLRMAPELETVCFRVIQEAVTNALRHARPRRIAVWLRREDSEVTVEVADDGAGFDVAAARRSAMAGKSGGVLGMEERVRLLGGCLRIDSRPRKGSRVEAKLPLPPHEAC